MLHQFIPCLPDDENFKKVKKDDTYTDEKSMSSWNLTLDQSKVCYICNRPIRDHEEGNDIDNVDQEADLLAQLTGAEDPQAFRRSSTVSRKALAAQLQRKMTQTRVNIE